MLNFQYKNNGHYEVMINDNYTVVAYNAEEAKKKILEMIAAAIDRDIDNKLIVPSIVSCSWEDRVETTLLNETFDGCNNGGH